MPTDPATVPTLTQKEIAEAYTVALTDTRWTDGTPWVDIAPVWRNQEVAFAHRIAALAAARVDHELKDKRDKVMHMHDLYDALGVEWGRDPFSAIAALKAARVDTAEVERRAKYDALTKLADEWNNAAFGVSGPHLTLNATLHASARMVLEFRDRECPAPAPRECVLSDGSVVWPDYSGQFARSNGPWCRGKTFGQWDIRVWDITAVLDSKRHTGADFDALKRFAAEVGQ